jgi:hypothetical protein
MPEPASFFTPAEPKQGDTPSAGSTDPISASIEAALAKAFPAGEGAQAQNFAALRSARVEEFVKALPADSKELLQLRAKWADAEPKVGRFGDLEKLYATVAYRETPEWKENFEKPLANAKAEIATLATDYGIPEKDITALEAMAPKDRRTKLEKDFGASLASDLERAFREHARASKAAADEAAKLGGEGKDVQALLKAVHKHYSTATDPGKHIEEVTAKLVAKDPKTGLPIDPFFGSKEGQEVIAGIKGKPINTDPTEVAALAVKAAGYDRIVGEYAKLYAELQQLRRDHGRFRQAQPGGGTFGGGDTKPGGSGGGDAGVQPARKGSFG